MFNSTDLVTRVIVTEPTDGSEPTTEGVGYVGIVQVPPTDDDMEDYVWVKFPEMVSLGPFGPMKGVTTRIPISDIQKLTQEQWDEGLAEDILKPQKFTFMGKEYEINEYEDLMKNWSSQKAQ